MDSEQQQQGAMEYAVVDTSKKKQKRNEQQNVSNLLRINNVQCTILRNQAHASRSPACAWFLEIVLVHVLVCVYAYACVYMSAPKGINN